MTSRSLAPPGVALVACSALGALVAVLPAAARPRVHAIVGAHVVVSPDRELESATVVLRDGLIEHLGPDVAAPPDATEIDGSDLWVYSAPIDPSTTLGQAGSSGEGASSGGRAGGGGGAQRPEAAGPVHPIARVRPETRAVDALRSFTGDRARAAKKHRDLGYAVVLTKPGSGIFRGSSAAILLADDVPVPELILRAEVAQHVSFERGRFGQGYPTSLMGAVATFRQVFLDTERQATWKERFARNARGMERPEHVEALDALAPVVAGELPLFFETSSPQDVLLADRLAREFELSAVISSPLEAWEIAEQVKATERTLVLPLQFPDKPNVKDEHERLNVTLQTMLRHVHAPEAAARLHEAGVRLAFTTDGLSSLSSFHANVRKCIEKGLPADAALAAVTTVPAEIMGIEEMAGTVEEGKLANLAIFDGPMFDEDSKLRHVFVDGVEYRMKERELPEGADPNAVVDPTGEWSVVLDFGRRKAERTWTIEGERDAYSGTAETQRGTVEFESVELEGNVLTVVLPGRRGRGATEVSVVVDADAFEGSMEMGPRSVTVTGTRRPEGGER